MQEFASEFLKFVTSEAQEQSEENKRKTITGDDVLHSLSRLGFDQYYQTTEWYYNRYKQVKDRKPIATGGVTGTETVTRTETALGAQQA